MDEMEEKLGAILNNPQMMQQIMLLAQSMNSNAPSQEKQEAPKQEVKSVSAPAQTMPDIDFSMIQKLSGLAGQSSISKEERALLNALGPYLSRDRVQKLEKAMRAEKMARIASTLLGQGGLPFLTGR